MGRKRTGPDAIWVASRPTAFSVMMAATGNRSYAGTRRHLDMLRSLSLTRQSRTAVAPPCMNHWAGVAARAAEVACSGLTIDGRCIRCRLGLGRGKLQ